MNVRFKLALVLSCATAVATGCSGGSGAIAPAVPAARTPARAALRTLATPLGKTSLVPPTAASRITSLCRKPVDSAHAGCFAAVRTDRFASAAFPAFVFGLTPYDLAALYAYPAPGFQVRLGAGQTVAIVVAYDNAAAESDLATYRSYFGLPPCTSANGCLSKTNAAATNRTSPVGVGSSITANPAASGAAGWAAETDADLDVVSAVCPNCKILLVEAATDSLADLTAAVTVAVDRRVAIVNASYGAPEDAGDVTLSPAYDNAAHVTVVAAAGDWGYGVYYPAADPSVIAVGGTTLVARGWQVDESAWSGSGSGCSRYFAKPRWQIAPPDGCAKRAVADVSAVADPNTGIAVYDRSLGGWAVFGGTSVAAPIVAAMDVLAGAAPSLGAQSIYAHPDSFLPVTGGSNGTCPWNLRYLCTAGSPYSGGPTGNGVPDGLRGF